VPTFVDKRAIVDLLGGEFRALASLSSSLTEAQWLAPTSLPGWTVHDVMAHVIGTESMLSGLPTPEVDVSGYAHVRNPVGQANEAWVASMRPLSGDEMLARFDDVTSGRMAALEALDQADFDAPSWTPAGRDETYGRLMRIRHYHCYLHDQDSRCALATPPRQDPADLESATDEVATGLGYIVGRKAALPDGSRVRIEVTGPLPRAWSVIVDGRATLVEGFDGPPTVGVTMPVLLFLRLTGGRDDGFADLDEQIGITGDVALGQRLVANLAFTI
jgi:uncharacterized protein (TIGR03083 family)